MTTVSSLVQSRFELKRLESHWQGWLDEDWRQVDLPGAFRFQLDPATLVQPVVPVIWPGFMLPDSLPIVGNDYGDWICVRLTDSDEMGELIHWYHGGGDWIPVGNSLCEAIIHDAIDQFRPITTQMLRGASESLLGGDLQDVLPRLTASPFRRWANVEGVNWFDELLHQLTKGDYASCVGLLDRQRLAEDAVACDLIELCLQAPLRGIANAEIARQVGMDWSAEFVEFLFDPATWLNTKSESGGLVAKLAAATGLATLPEQDWSTASDKAAEVLQRRRDLSWPFDILGWARLRAGQTDEASQLFRQGLMTSNFSSQAVRLRSHWGGGDHGKFSAARLADLSQSHGDYFDSLTQPIDAGDSRQAVVMRYWLNLAAKAEQSGASDEAYRCYCNAGWDLGAPTLRDYQTILRGLMTSAREAGWASRARVAELHLSCLQSRLR